MAIQRLELLLDLLVRRFLNRLGRGQQALGNLVLINLEVVTSQQSRSEQTRT